MPSNVTRSVCKGCRNAYYALNGLYCTRLKRYVEYNKVQPCTQIFQPKK